MQLFKDFFILKCYSVFFFFKVVAFINICKIVFDEKKTVYSNACSLLLGFNTIDINNQMWGFFFFKFLLIIFMGIILLLIMMLLMRN